MKELLAHATTLGVSVHVAHIDGPQRGFYDADNAMVVYDFELTPIEQTCVLAHELGHVFYDHRCHGDLRAEDDADFYAACLLINPETYAEAARIDSSPDALAEALGVEPRLIHVFRRRALVRVGEVTYVRPKMGRGQYAWRAFA